MESLNPLFFELGVIIVSAAVFGVAAKAFKQPPILGYILAGIILGPIGASLIQSQENLKAFSTFGIALLLFLVGLEMDWKKLRQLSTIAGTLSIVQMLGTFGLSFLTAIFFGLDFVNAFIISLALAFSSTIVVIKLLSEKHDLDSLYGRLTVSTLLAQDLVAIFAIALLAGSAGFQDFSFSETIILMAVKTTGLVITAWFFSAWIFPKLFAGLARSHELLFIVSLAWCFAFSILTVKIGFSLEIGAFLAGISLASLPYTIDIVGRIKSLRDFFIILFFVVLGTELSLTALGDWRYIVIFTVLAVIAKPVIIFITLSLLGLRRRTSFLTGLSLGQMSEFSLILSGLALELGLANQDIAAMITITTAISLLISPYLINNSESIFRFLRPYLAIFERRNGQKYSLELGDDLVLTNHVIIFGYHRMGYHILKTLRNLGRDVLVIDFNPEVIDRLRKLKIPTIFGDAQDEELLESVHLKNAKMIISTIPHHEETLFLIHKIRSLRTGMVAIVTAKTVEEALEYYSCGADYVILPAQLSGEYVAEILRKYEDKTIRKFLRKKMEEVKLLKTKNHALYVE